jgi:hypothetical protein
VRPARYTGCCPWVDLDLVETDSFHFRFDAQHDLSSSQLSLGMAIMSRKKRVMSAL